MRPDTVSAGHKPEEIRTVKIIGTTIGGFLCEVSSAEIYRITGNEEFRYRGRFADNINHRQVAIGTSIDVDIRWSKMIAMEQNRTEMERALKTIRAVADVLEPCLPNIELPPAPSPDAFQQIVEMQSQSDHEIAS